MAESLVDDVENARLLSLQSYRIINTLPEKEYDRITRLAAYICQKPVALITFIDHENAWVKSQYGINARTGRRENSICSLTIGEDSLLEIPDTRLDPRTANVTDVLEGPGISYYAGAPLIAPDGSRLGALCVVDVQPGKLNEDQKSALIDLSKQVVSHLEARKTNLELNALIAKHEEINTMFNNSAELQIITDRNGTILVINKAVEKLLGYSPEEGEGRAIWDFFHEEDLRRLVPLLSEGLSSGKKNFEVEARVRLKDGTAKWMGYSVAVKNDKWYANGRDISEQKKMIAELETLSLVASKSASGVIIRDGQGKVIWINAAIEAMLGYKLEELQGRLLSEVVAGENTDAGSLEVAIKAISERKSYRIDLQIYKKDGTPIWIHSSTTPILNDAGEIERQVEIMNDITESKYAEEQLTLLSLVASKTKNGVAISTSDGRIKWVNDALEKLTGYSLEDFRNTRPGDLLSGEGTDLELLEMARKQASECIPSNIELLSYKKDGTPIWLSISNTPTFNKDGSLDQQVEIINDISERKLAEQELIKTREEALHLSKAKETFLSVMSHEIRTPLNAVIGMSNILLDDDPTESQMENLKILGFSAQNLLKLINDILDFTKIETGNMILESVNVNLKELVSQTLTSLQFKTAGKPVILKSEIDHRIPTHVKGDNIRLYQILMNLLGNSVKFTEAGEVKLKLDLIQETKENVQIRFEISDTGIGIEPDKIDYIFASYTQASSDTTRKYGGTGLGLAITKSLLQLYNSDISVESEIGKGSKFSFIIEFSRSQENPLQEEYRIPVDQLNATILVVDDNEINRILAGKVLSKWGLQVDFAENGQIALDKVVQSRFDLVLMDLHMPVMDGMQSAMEIRKLGGEYSKLPIVALTASVFAHELETISECGIDGYVMKPFVPGELYAKISGILAER